MMPQRAVNGGIWRAAFKKLSNCHALVRAEEAPDRAAWWLGMLIVQCSPTTGDRTLPRSRNCLFGDSALDFT